MFKIILNLLLNGAGKSRWRLEIGAYLLRKGAKYQIGQILSTKQINDKTYRVKVIDNLFYDFKENKINHTTTRKVIKR